MRLECLHRRAKIGLKQQRARAGMVQYGNQFRLRKPHIDRHHNAARHDHAVVAFQQLMRVETQIRHSVSRQHSQLFQPHRQPLTTRAELGIGELFVPANDPDFPGKNVHGAIQKSDGSERQNHSGPTIDCILFLR